MDLKNRVIKSLVFISVTIVLCVSIYLVYFVAIDDLVQPDDCDKKSNLFLIKQHRNIEKLKTKEDLRSCKLLHDSILLDLNEDQINVFLDTSMQKNSKRYVDLCLKTNVVYAEQFVVLAKKYFDQFYWHNNNFLTISIDDIKRSGAIERGSHIWNSLQEFQNNIFCYSEMQDCVSEINTITSNLKNYIPVDQISALKEKKEHLINRNCEKNENLEAELKNRYENLESQAKESVRLVISPTTHLEFEASGGSRTIKIKTNVSSWSYGGVYPWLSIKNKGSSLIINCMENDAAIERKDNFTIKAYGKETKVYIRQKMKEQKKITGNIEKISVENNVYQNGQLGIKIHVNFNTSNMSNIDGRCSAYFYDENRVALKDSNNSYRTSDGDVSVGLSFYPKSEIYASSDFVLFMPYNELHLSDGESSTLTIKIILWAYPSSNKPQNLANSNWIYFNPQ